MPPPYKANPSQASVVAFNTALRGQGSETGKQGMFGSTALIWMNLVSDNIWIHVIININRQLGRI